MRDWFVIASHAGKENIARHNLENQHIECFLPARKKTVRHFGRTETVIAPLFPGYIFARFDAGPAAIRAVNGTRGVKYLLSNGGMPSALPRGFVESLLCALDRDGVISHQQYLKPGELVEFACGPFASQMGKLMDMDERGRVTVLLNTLVSHIPVATTVSNILPA
jgi:transcriptional antiterminator RfaH